MSMHKFEIQLMRRTRGQIDDIVEAVGHHPEFHWQFQHSGEIIDRAGDDISNVYLQIGMTMGARGKMFICGPNEGDLMHFRLKMGI